MIQKYQAQLSAQQAAIVKGMLNRGDRQSDIATYFRTNPGRISEINTGLRFGDVLPAPYGSLPPAEPFDMRRAS